MSELDEPSSVGEMLTKQLCDGAITAANAQEVFLRYYGRKNRVIEKEPVAITIQDAEKQTIIAALELGLTMARTADKLGICTRTLRNKMCQYDLYEPRPIGRPRGSKNNAKWDELASVNG